ncbi:MAG: LemA family protein [Mycoplasma sp.]
MLLDTRNQSVDNQKGFNPNVQNQKLEPKAAGWMWVFIVLFYIFTLGLFGFWYMAKRNWFNRMQNQINTSASNISVQLAQRRDTLVKLLDATKSHMKYEKSVLTDVTKLRNMNINPNATPAQVNKALKSIDSLGSRIFATFENYPDLKAGASIVQLMNAAEINERELAASRRLYNADVNMFNQELFAFPSEFVAARNHLGTFPLFIANAEQQKDVSLDIQI